MKFISFLKKSSIRICIGGILLAVSLVVEYIFGGFLPLYIFALVAVGFGTYIDAVKGILRRDFLDERFLTSIASIGAFVIGEYIEGIAVMLFFVIGETFENLAVGKSRRKIRNLMNICPDEARVLKGEEEIVVDADEVLVGDVIVIKPGERVPVDSVVISGAADIDSSALTGESFPIPLSEGSEINSGCIVLGGVIVCRAIREAEESSAQRILNIVENANENKAPEEKFITSFSKVYTPIVVFLALIMAVLPSALGITVWSESIYRALMFLVISCPCALVISVPLAFFGGIGAAASRGILFKGASSFSPISRIRAVAFDKTGTLTTGEFRVGEILSENIEKEELLSLAASVERGSNHPIAKCIVAQMPDAKNACDIKEIPGKGTIGVIGGDKISVGNAALMKDVGVSLPTGLQKSDKTLVFVARNDELVGAFDIIDDIKPEASDGIAAIRKIGVEKTFILSGDKKARVMEIGRSLPIDEVFSELLPEDKYRKIEELKNIYGCTAYVGDGINDAPALAVADVGIAMGGIGSDAAIESADLVIISDKITKISEAVKIASSALLVAKENIVFALGVKLVIMLCAIFGVANMWLAVMADVGVSVLAILNSMRTLLAGRRNSK